MLNRFLITLFWSFYITVSTFSQKPELVIPTLLGSPTGIKTFADSRYLLVMSNNNTQIWETNRGLLLKTFPFTSYYMAENADKTQLAITGKDLVYMLDARRLTLTDSFRINGASLLKFLPDGHSVCVFGKQAVEMIHVPTKSVSTFYKLPNGSSTYVNSLDVSNDGRKMIVQASDGPAHLIDIASRQLLKTFSSKTNLYAFSPDNKILEIEIKDQKISQLNLLNSETYQITEQVRGTTNILPASIRNLFWLDKRRLYLFNRLAGTIADFNNKTFSPDFQYHTEEKSAFYTCEGKRENGAVRTIFRSISYPENTLEEWDLTSNKLLRTVGYSLIFPLSVAVAPDGWRLQYGAKYEVQLGRTINFWKYDSRNEYAVYTADGKTRIQVGKKGAIEKFRSMDQSGAPMGKLTQGIQRESQGAVLSKNGNLGAAIGENGMYIFDANNLTLLQDISISTDVTAYHFDLSGVFFDKDKKIVAHGVSQNKEDLTYCAEVSTGKILWTVNKRYKHFRETSEGILCFDDNTVRLVWLNPKNGQEVKSQNITGKAFDLYKNHSSVAFSPDASQIILTENDKVFFWDVKKQALLPGANSPSSSPVLKAGFFPNNPAFAFTLNRENRLMLWNTQQGKFLASVFLFPQTKDWVCLTPDGRFDASPDAMRKLYFVKGLDIIPLEQLYEKYYTPGLLAQLLNGENLPPIQPDDDIKNLKRPPVVQLRYDDKQRNLVVEDDSDVPSVTVAQSPITLIVEATAPDDVVEEIRLFQNGKLIAGNTRNLVVEDDRPQQDTRSFSVELVPGDNLFRAVALNSQRTESRPAELLIKYTPATPTPSTSTSDITLYAIVIGINKYKNPKYNLNYAFADASAFKDQIQQVGKDIFKNVQINFITDENATLTGITQALDKIKSAAQPKDVFILYYAGHGVLDGKRDFYLVPHDVTQLYGNDEALAQKGLSANQLQQFSKDIKAQKQLFILDACQSAGAIEQVAMRGAAEEKAIAQLARSTGTHWLTASGSEQFASEFAQLGHGTFTYALLEALGGKADTGDKRITVKEIDAYLQAVVPELTAKYKGTPQYPASYGFGNDFPVGVIR